MSFRGTESYMSPELINVLKKQAYNDINIEKTNVFSIGMILI